MAWGPRHTGASMELPPGVWGVVVLPGVLSASISWYLWSCLLLPTSCLLLRAQTEVYARRKVDWPIKEQVLHGEKLRVGFLAK